MLNNLPPTSRDLGIKSREIAAAYDSAIKDRVITVQEGELILGAEVRHRELPRSAIPDLETIATQAGCFFERRHSWVDRDRFDTIVDFTLRTGGRASDDVAAELAGTLATLNDPLSMAHLARALEKLRANDAFSENGARAIDDAYYAKLQGMDKLSAGWRGQAKFDHAIAVLLGAEELGPCEPRAEQQIAHALGQVNKVESLPHVLRSIEKVRANDKGSKMIDDALYALLQKLDGPAAITDARKTFVDRLAALRGC